jgi:hypothetical protein
MEDLKQKTLIYACRNKNPVMLKKTLSGMTKSLFEKKFNYSLALVNIEIDEKINATVYQSLLECLDEAVRPIFHSDVYHNISKDRIAELTSFPEKMFFPHEKNIFFVHEKLSETQATSYIYKWEQSLIKN